MTAFLLWLAAAAQARLGATATVAVAAVAGFADAHAATASIGGAAGRLPVGSAMWPVLAAFSTNTLTKIGLATAAGGYRFALQQVGAGLVASGATGLGPSRRCRCPERGQGTGLPVMRRDGRRMLRSNVRDARDARDVRDRLHAECARHGLPHPDGRSAAAVAAMPQK